MNFLRFTRLLPIVLVFLAQPLITGCSTLFDGEEVVVFSTPDNATIYINGKLAGQTPMTTRLARNMPHEVVFEKAGHRMLAADIIPIPDVSSKKRLRLSFSFDKDAGFPFFKRKKEEAYTTLLWPNPLTVELIPNIVPASEGNYTFNDMISRVMLVDEMLADNQINAAEHQYMIRKLVEFFDR